MELVRQSPYTMKKLIALFGLLAVVTMALGAEYKMATLNGRPIIINGKAWGVAVAGELWTPADMTGLVGWWELEEGTMWADLDGTTPLTTHGTRIARWDDKSGNGRNFTNVSSTGHFYLTNFWTNAHVTSPALAGGGLHYDAEDFVFTNQTVYGVFYRVAGGNNGRIFTQKKNTSIDYAYGIIPIIGQNSASVGSYWSAYTRMQSCANNEQVVWGAVRGTNFLLSSKNGNIVSNPASPLAETVNIFGIQTAIGNMIPADSDANMEWVLGSEALDLDERQKLEGYLAHQWGLQDKLDASHPYKANPPTK